MKQVMNEIPPATTTLLRDTTIFKCYGVLHISGDKGFIHRDDFLEGKFRIRCSHSITGGNQWKDKRWNSASLYSVIKNILNDPNENFTVFEFDSAKELFKWLSE